MNKRIKFLKYIFKNKTSFIDFKIQFYFNLGYNHHVSSSEIENIKKYEFTFNDKTLNQKQEIKLNNFLIKLLNCFKIYLMKEGLKIDVKLMNKNELKYNEKENTLKRISFNYCKFFSATLKKISKKNCNSNENKFLIKILKTNDADIFIGLTNLNFNFKENNDVFGDGKNSWGFWCHNGNKLFNNRGEDFLKGYKGKNGDIIGLKYNSIKGNIEIFINNESKGIMFNDININQDYRFGITLYHFRDKIQILQ